jgi:hypothetical protein
MFLIDLETLLSFLKKKSRISGLPENSRNFQEISRNSRLEKFSGIAYL